MRATGDYSPRDLGVTEAQVARALAEAGLPSGVAKSWLSSAASSFEHDAQWSLDYDVELQVATFEVWKDGKLVFGLDDWLPSS